MDRAGDYKNGDSRGLFKLACAVRSHSTGARQRTSDQNIRASRGWSIALAKPKPPSSPSRIRQRSTCRTPVWQLYVPRLRGFHTMDIASRRQRRKFCKCCKHHIGDHWTTLRLGGVRHLARTLFHPPCWPPSLTLPQPDAALEYHRRPDYNQRLGALLDIDFVRCPCASL